MSLRERLETAGWLWLPPVLPASMLQALPVDAALPSGRAGARDLLARPWCAALVAPLRAALQACGLLPADAVAVQCTLFRKGADCNWNVPYHQGLSIPVAARVAHPALSGWSCKDDGQYVQPPADLLATLLAVRLHLDPAGEAQGALRVVPGSHRWGRIPPRRIAEVRAGAGEVVCTAAAGDLLLMRPLLLHASSRAAQPAGRRVLHVLFAPPAPGFGLHWRMTA